MSLYTKALHLAPFLRWLMHIRAEGGENLPASGPVVLCCNHRSDVDPVLLGASLGRPLFFMAKYELFRIPVFRRLIIALGAFPVRRGEGDTEAVRKAMEIVSRGDVLAMFPEGTRQKSYGPPRRFKRGAVLFAARTGAPIVPAALICKKPVRLFNRKTVRIGKPVTPAQLGFTDGSPENLRLVSENLRQTVLKLMEE